MDKYSWVKRFTAARKNMEEDDNIRYKIVVREGRQWRKILFIIEGEGGIKNVSFTFYVKIKNKKNQEKSSSYSMETKRADRVSRDTHEEDWSSSRRI